MDYSAIIQSATWAQVATAVLLIFAALAGLEVVLSGGRYLLDAISNQDDSDDYEDSDDDDEYGGEFGTHPYDHVVEDDDDLSPEARRFLESGEI